jgi:c-di-GMP phosphodiesterase
MSRTSFIKKTVPPEMQQRWQHVVDTLAAVFEVPAALIMRHHTKELEVFASSLTGGNPFVVGAKESLRGKLYCEEAIRSGKLLHVEDAESTEKWKGNSDITMGLSSYLGLPISWPNGENFGTICVLDRKPISRSALLESLLYSFSTIVEDELHLLVEIDERKRYQNLLQGKMSELAEFNKELIRREKRILELKERISPPKS